MTSTNRAAASRSSPPSVTPSSSARLAASGAHLAAEEVAQPLALAKARRHAVEAGRRVPHFRGVEDGNANLEVALLDRREGVAKALEGVGDRAGEGDRADQADADGHRGEDDGGASELVDGRVRRGRKGRA